VSKTVSVEPTALVLTALQVEMTAVMAHISSAVPEPVGPVVCDIGHFVASNGLSWRVVAAELGPGTVDTASAVVAMTATFRPAVLMFVGIAGALKDDVRIGDVVAGTAIAWTERGKESERGYLPRVQTVSLSYQLSQWARRVAREGSWIRRLQHPRDSVKAVVAQIASGEKVIAAGQQRAELRDMFSDAVAIENEGFGLARAAEVYADGEACVIRGISDAADGNKSDQGQPDAADAAAAFAFELLDAYSGVQATAAIVAPVKPAESLIRAERNENGTEDLLALAHELVTDVDMLEDDRDQVEQLARDIIDSYEDSDVSVLVQKVGSALQEGVSPLIGRRLQWFGRQLLRSAGVRLAEWRLEESAKSAPRGMALLLTEPTVWSRCPDAARRRCLTALLGPSDNPKAPDAQAVEILTPLLSSGMVDEREAARVRSSFDLAAFELLIAHGMNLDMLMPRILEDLDSGIFNRQNAAARFLYRLRAPQSEQPLDETSDISLGEKLVRAASGSPPSFGAAEAMTLSYLSSWPGPRLAGGIWAALTFDGKMLSTVYSKYLPNLIAAAAGKGDLGEVLNRVCSLLDDSLERGPDDWAEAISNQLLTLARNYTGSDQEALSSFAAWIQERN
jgi:nucleoside phosphorylase